MRSTAFLSPAKGILVPGKKPLGFANHLLSLFGSQVKSTS